jgi:CMP-N-acetylneuraminic acid synthetase
MKVVAFVPMRLNSKRIAQKNLRMLGGKPLLFYIFNTLLQVNKINDIYAYCSSESVIPLLPANITFLKRDKQLDDDLTLGREIYESFCNTVDADIYILAHTTSPFIKAESINFALDKVLIEGYDSAFSVQQFKTFAWYNNKPLNYQLSHIPRTQDLKPVFIETSAFFIFTREIWINKKQRIGDNPFLQIVNNIEGIDIDNPEDFNLAEKITLSLESK